MLDSSGLGLPAAVGSENHIGFAVRRLRQACLACDLAPGSYVHEAELATRFGLGRAAVRVALTELGTAGFVTRHPRQGWLVTPVDGALATGILEGRRLLEPALADAALDEAQRMSLRNWRAMIEAVRARDEAQARALASRLHRQALDLMAQRSGPLLAAWLCELWDHAERLNRALELSGRPVPLGDLGPLIEAVLAGDRQAALAALAEDQVRFKAAVAEAFLGAAHLGSTPTRTRMRKRGAAKPNFQPSPSQTIAEETSR